MLPRKVIKIRPDAGLKTVTAVSLTFSQAAEGSGECSSRTYVVLLTAFKLTLGRSRTRRLTFILSNSMGHDGPRRWLHHRRWGSTLVVTALPVLPYNLALAAGLTRIELRVLSFPPRFTFRRVSPITALMRFTARGWHQRYQSRPRLRACIPLPK